MFNTKEQKLVLKSMLAERFPAPVIGCCDPLATPPNHQNQSPRTWFRQEVTGYQSNARAAVQVFSTLFGQNRKTVHQEHI